MGIDGIKSAESARFRSNIYGLLATVFRQEPSEALITELRDPRLSGVISDLGVDLGEVFYSTPENELRETLGLEFTRLFIGPDSHISAHESVFAEMDSGIGGLWGARTVEVKNFIETTGLDYNPEFTGVPDHISVELEFMQRLTEWEADKWDQDDRENAEYCQSIQRMFLEQHLLPWAPQFCDAVIAQAEIPFYRGMSELAKNYLEVEQQSITTDVAA
jgi:putative dimethyl sulfoxide reductase chaperone